MTKKYIDRILEFLLVVLMGAMVINVLWQVFSRYLLNDPSTITEELARFILIWVGLLGAAYVTGQKGHLAIDIVLQNCGERLSNFLNLTIYMVIFLFSALTLVAGGINLVFLTLSLKQTSAALQMQLGYVYLAVPLSGILICVYTVLLAVEHRRECE